MGFQPLSVDRPRESGFHFASQIEGLAGNQKRDTLERIREYSDACQAGTGKANRLNDKNSRFDSRPRKERSNRRKNYLSGGWKKYRRSGSACGGVGREIQLPLQFHQAQVKFKGDITTTGPASNFSQNSCSSRFFPDERQRHKEISQHNHF